MIAPAVINLGQLSATGPYARRNNRFLLFKLTCLVVTVEFLRTEVDAITSKKQVSGVINIGSKLLAQYALPTSEGAAVDVRVYLRCFYEHAELFINQACIAGFLRQKTCNAGICLLK